MMLRAQFLLEEPEPEDAHDMDVAEQFIRDYGAFCATAQAWTKHHGRSLQPNDFFIWKCSAHRDGVKVVMVRVRTP